LSTQEEKKVQLASNKLDKIYFAFIFRIELKIKMLR
jgi:hypothetical protein